MICQVSHGTPAARSAVDVAAPSGIVVADVAARLVDAHPSLRDAPELVARQEKNDRPRGAVAEPWK
jgi:hypothetical protein